MRNGPGRRRRRYDALVSSHRDAGGGYAWRGGERRLALEILHRSEFDLGVTDLRMPDVSGMELLREGRAMRPEARWVIVTAYGSIGSAVEAIKAGASDYLTKPFRDPDEMRHVVRRVLREAEAEARISLLSEELGRRFPPVETIFLGGKMEEVHRLVREVAPTTATVLVTGPSGTGKELVSRVIHALSPRKEKPFRGGPVLRAGGDRAGKRAVRP